MADQIVTAGQECEHYCVAYFWSCALQEAVQSKGFLDIFGSLEYAVSHSASLCVCVCSLENRMIGKNSIVALILSFSLAPAAGSGLAQAQPAKEFEPQVGQEGKDVIWVPTPQALVDKMLEMAKVTPKDYVIDLGSGDGRTVITAAKRGLEGARHRIQSRHG